MRKIKAQLLISLDGVVEAPDPWHFPYFNDERGAAVDAALGRADTLLLGRRTYDSFAGAWPDREAAPSARARSEHFLSRAAGSSGWSGPGRSSLRTEGSAGVTGMSRPDQREAVEPARGPGGSSCR